MIRTIIILVSSLLMKFKLAFLEQNKSNISPTSATSVSPNMVAKKIDQTKEQKTEFLENLQNSISQTFDSSVERIQKSNLQAIEHIHTKLTTTIQESHKDLKETIISSNKYLTDKLEKTFITAHKDLKETIITSNKDLTDNIQQILTKSNQNLALALVESNKVLCQTIVKELKPHYHFYHQRRIDKIQMEPQQIQHQHDEQLRQHRSFQINPNYNNNHIQQPEFEETNQLLPYLTEQSMYEYLMR